MADTRQRALAHLHRIVGEFSGKLVSTSKFYKPEESWTQKETWWFDLPINKIESNATDNFYLCCENRNDFIFLRVPNKFLLDNRDKFDTKSKENTIRLHLAAYSENWLVDERIENGVDFSQFEIK
jgi:hypothetical protein